MISLKARLAEVQLALEKLADDSFRTESELRAEMSVVEDWLREKKTRVECLECEKPLSFLLVARSKVSLLSDTSKTKTDSPFHHSRGEAPLQGDLRKSLVMLPPI